jgi:hypothetical protein
MGWRDRDWAKFDEGELKSFLGPASAPTRRRSNRRVVGGATLLAAGISAVAIIFTAHVHDLGEPGHAAAHVLSPAPAVVAPSTDVVRIRWSPAETAPASNAGRICVTDARHGRICASYVVGERPADTLTRRIESLGLRVESSG